MVILNSSGQPQLLDAMDYFKAREDGVRVAAIICQEHKARGLDWNSLRAKAKAKHWHLQGAQAAHQLGGGLSAGVGIATRGSINMGLPAGERHDISPGESQGRLALAWSEGIVRGGMIVMSTYLWHSEGMTVRNRAILEQAGLQAKKFKGPWLLAGDMNMTPEQFEAGASDWLRKVGGVIVRPTGATCRSSSGGRTIDFCVMDARMLGAVASITLDQVFPSSPHYPVRLRIRGAAVKEYVNALRRPACFDVDKPTGCMRRPQNLGCEALEVLERLEESAGGGHQRPTEKLAAMGIVVEGLFDAAEGQLCRICDKVLEDGSPDPKFLGRAKGLKVVRQLLVPKAAAELGIVDAITMGLHWLRRALRDLAILICVVDKGRAFTRQMALQWNAIMKTCRSPTGCLRKLLDDEAGQRWRFRLEGVGLVHIGSVSVVAVLKEWAADADQQARKRSAASSREAARGWWEWVDEQLRKGAGALHLFAKRDENMQNAQVPIESVDGPTLGIQALVDKDREVWKEVWERFKGSATAPWRKELHLPWAGRLPKITGASLADAGRKFKKHTSLGSDAFRPGWFCWLSEGLLDQFARTLVVVEEAGAWPEVVSTLLVAQIPKSDGGRRPIGLLPTLVRVWEKLRKPIMDAWRSTVQRSYNFAAKGKSSDVAAWIQAHNAEVAAARGGFAAATLVDLTKAFEMVRLELVWMAGLRMHWPPEILRLVLEAFGFARRLMYMGVVADPIYTLSAILAGGGYAVDALFMVMSGVCDRVLIEEPEASLCLFVDDMAIQVLGADARSVGACLERATQFCIAELEVGLGLVVSRGKANSKTVALTSSHSRWKKRPNKEAHERLTKGMKALGVHMVKQTKMLGVDFSVGKKIKRTEQAARVRKVSKRLPRIRQLGSGAARHIVKTGVGPTMRYGASACGITNTTLRAVRNFSCGAIGEMRGRSTFARLTLASYDVGALMATDPIVQWAKAVWDRLVVKEDMRDSWKKAMVEVATAVRPFGAVVGPAGAMVASALRIGWKVPSPHHLQMADGVLLNLHEVAPKDVQLLATRDLMHVEARASSLVSSVGGPPDLVPLRDFIKGKRSSKVVAALRALGEGGWWTQERMYEANMSGVESNLCQVCHGQVGTLYHRFCGCPGISELMEDSKGFGEVLGMARSALHSDDPLFKTGVPVLQGTSKPPGLVTRWCGGRVTDDPTFTGDVFSDGSVVGGCRKGDERAGWAAVKADDQGKVVFGVYGTCPDFFPTSLRAELWGVLQTLRHAMPPIIIWVDNAGVVDGFGKGRQWCVDSARPAADLWSLVWAKVEDLGKEGIRIVKTKGHATEADLEAGRSSWWQKAGNDHADHFAKRGSALAEEMASTSSNRKSYLLARKWYGWLSVLIANWPADTQRRQGKEGGRRRQRGSAEGAAGGGAAEVMAGGSGVLAVEGTSHTGSNGAAVNGAAVDRIRRRLREAQAKEGKPAEEKLREEPTRREEASIEEAMQRRQAAKRSRGREAGSEVAAVTGKPAAKMAKREGPSFGRGHKVYQCGTLYWCDHCGAYAEQRLRSLKLPCPGSENKGQRASQLARMRRGMHPLKEPYWLAGEDLLRLLRS